MYYGRKWFFFRLKFLGVMENVKKNGRCVIKFKLVLWESVCVWGGGGCIVNNIFYFFLWIKFIFNLLLKLWYLFFKNIKRV